MPTPIFSLVHPCAHLCKNFFIREGFTNAKVCNLCSLALPISVASAQSPFNQKGGLKPIQVPPAQTPTPVGFTSVLCVADGLSGITLPPGPIDLGTVHIEALSAAVPNGNVSTITISTTNNTTSTTRNYVVTFVDTNADNALGCGDTVISIVPAS